MMNLKIAIQKSGRLKENSLKLLKDAGINFDNGADSLKTVATNFPLELLHLRNSDIPGYVSDSVAELGIVGQNLLFEQNKSELEDFPLGFGKCKLVLAIQKKEQYQGINYFSNKKIATSYPNSLCKFLQSSGIKADIHNISGSVEIAPNIGLSDAICDLVSTGSTLFNNGLKDVETIYCSEACLIKSKSITGSKNVIYKNLKFRIRSVLEARNNKYVLLNAPNENIRQIIKILPGIKSPTILPLALKGWSSMHSVINENMFWQVIDQLKEAGAEGILVCPIEKMIK